MSNDTPICPKCSGTETYQTGIKPDKRNILTRTYGCTNDKCPPFTTKEDYAPTTKNQLHVKKSNPNKGIQAFSIENIRNGISTAGTETITPSEIICLSREVERILHKADSSINNPPGISGKIFHSHEIGEIVLSVLKKQKCHVAALRFLLSFRKNEFTGKPHFQAIIANLTTQWDDIS